MASLTTILDMVKVMAFALQEGRVAVHCHAGLGRTGKCALLQDQQNCFSEDANPYCHNLLMI